MRYVASTHTWRCSIDVRAADAILLDTQLERLIKSLPKATNPAVAETLGHYYEAASELIYLNNWMINSALSASQGSKHITPGRVVVLRDARYEMNVAIVLRAVTTMSTSSDVSGKSFVVLTLVDADEEPREGGTIFSLRFQGALQSD